GLEEAIVRPDPSWSLVYRGLVRLDGGRLVGDLARDVRIERAARRSSFACAWTAPGSTAGRR
ncbi:hypothetical protein AB1399_00210, partial [Hydrogenibacillus schlegelii]|uniref:hypothetical protein n=1 Tax=Hydrogenibacillus schlegelii TaxID=1484 RepID=UPI0034A0AB7C